MDLTRADVLHVAKLAKLKLANSEVEPLLADLARILEYMELLNEVDTTEVPPMTHVVVSCAPLRDDIVLPLLASEDVLAEAPRRSEDSFAVPAFLDEG